MLLGPGRVLVYTRRAVAFKGNVKHTGTTIGKSVGICIVFVFVCVCLVGDESLLPLPCPTLFCLARPVSTTPSRCGARFSLEPSLGAAGSSSPSTKASRQVHSSGRPAGVYQRLGA